MSTITRRAACAAALASLPLQTPHRLRRLLDMWSPEDAWNTVMHTDASVFGISDSVVSVWRGHDPSVIHRVEEQCSTAGVWVAVRGDDAYPTALATDIDAPAVLFCSGDPAALAHRCVGIIGTRNATQAGRHLSRTLGRLLADNGVTVVSGLARGIDVESHRGALDSERSPHAVAVVAGGPDVVYPREHAAIWRELPARGLIISEMPPGVHPEPFRFPQRNRIIAALSEVLVVVESRETGGSMTTVREAMKRDIAVMAVPGSPHVPSCAGTNSLLRDGCAPVTSVDDVLVALGFEHRLLAGLTDTRPEPRDPGRRVLVALGDMPRTIDEVALSTGLAVIDVAVALGQLETQGWVAHSDGWWEALTR